MRRFMLRIILVLTVMFLWSPAAHAQTLNIQGENIERAQEFNAASKASVDPLEMIEVWERIERVNPAIDLEQMPSLFLTPSEQTLLQEARLGLTTRAPTDSELRQAGNGTAPPIGPRELAVGGIVYLSAGDWAVWLNGQKITPDRLLPEILDIKVRKGSVKLKWFDAYTNQIFPIKLRTHQRFNIDTRIFLPGEVKQGALSQ